MYKNTLLTGCLAAAMSTISYSAYADPDIYIRRQEMLPDQIVASHVVEEAEPIVLVKATPGIQVKGSMSTGGYVNIGPYGADENFLPSAISIQKPEKPRHFGLISPSLRLSLKKESLFRGSIVQFIAKGGVNKEKARLSAAYLSHKHLEFGLIKSNFCAPVDAGGMGVPCSAVANSAMQIRLKSQLGDFLDTALSLEQSAGLDAYPEIEKEADKLNQAYVAGNNIPALSLSLKSNMGQGDRVTVNSAGLLRVVDVYESASRKTNFLPTWGANLSTVVQLVPEQTTLKLYGVYGQGIGSYLSDFGATPKTHRKDVYLHNNALVPFATYGGYFAFKQAFSPKLKAILAGGFLKADDIVERGKDHYKTGTYASLSMEYKPTEQISVGGGYIYADRTLVSVPDRNYANRLYTELSYSF